MAKEEWKASPLAARMDRIDPDMPSKTYGKVAERLPRRQASILIQLRTEHVPLQKFFFRIQKEDTPTCPSCRTTRETVYHYLMECPAFNEQRDQLARDAGPAARSMKDLLNPASTMRPLFRYRCCFPMSAILRGREQAGGSVLLSLGAINAGDLLTKIQMWP